LIAQSTGFRHPGTFSRNSEYQVADALVPRLQAVATAALEALVDLHLDPAH
jgi:hypothetical protein